MNTTTDSEELQDLYRELVLDHARQPRNFRRPANATHTAEGINPLCGDKLRLYLTIDSNDTLIDAAFEGSGCAISMASASLLTESVTNLSVEDAETCFKSVNKRLTQEDEQENPPTTVDLSKLSALDGVRRYPARIKCATLAWHALYAALTSQKSATTE